MNFFHSYQLVQFIAKLKRDEGPVVGGCRVGMVNFRCVVALAIAPPGHIRRATMSHLNELLNERGLGTANKDVPHSTTIFQYSTVHHGPELFWRSRVRGRAIWKLSRPLSALPFYSVLVNLQEWTVPLENTKMPQNSSCAGYWRNKVGQTLRGAPLAGYPTQLAGMWGIIVY